MYFTRRNIKIPAAYLSRHDLAACCWVQLVSSLANSDFMQYKIYFDLHFGPIFAMVCPDIGIALSQSSKYMKKHILC